MIAAQLASAKPPIAIGSSAATTLRKKIRVSSAAIGSAIISAEVMSWRAISCASSEAATCPPIATSIGASISRSSGSMRAQRAQLLGVAAGQRDDHQRLVAVARDQALLRGVEVRDRADHALVLEHRLEQVEDVGANWRSRTSAAGFAVEHEHVGRADPEAPLGLLDGAIRLAARAPRSRRPGDGSPPTRRRAPPRPAAVAITASTRRGRSAIQPPSRAKSELCEASERIRVTYRRTAPAGAAAPIRAAAFSRSPSRALEARPCSASRGSRTSST